MFENSAQEKRGAWRERLTGISSGITFTQKSSTISQFETKIIERIAVLNDTTDNADVLISIERGGYNHVLYYFKNVTVDEWKTVRCPLTLWEGERLVAEWSGVVVGERVDLHISGQRIWS